MSSYWYYCLNCGTHCKVSQHSAEQSLQKFKHKFIRKVICFNCYTFLINILYAQGKTNLLSDANFMTNVNHELTDMLRDWTFY